MPGSFYGKQKGSAPRIATPSGGVPQADNGSKDENGSYESMEGLGPNAPHRITNVLHLV